MNNLLNLTGRRGFAKTLRLTNINRLVGINRENQLKEYNNVEVIITKGVISQINDNTNVKEVEGVKTIDTQGALVTPAFVDPHTHLFPTKDRSHEFSLRATKTYEEIAAAGGGIKSSVAACREATFDEIYKVNEQIVKRFIAQGTLTLEIKSGYGLNTETEIKLLKVIQALKTNYKKYVDIVPTFMGAHDIPLEFKGNPEAYADLLINEMIPAVKAEKLAEFCDIFCENGYFNVQLANRILKAAQANKFKLRLHADEFIDSGAAQLAAKLNAYSADHLMAVSDKGIEALAKKNVIATILPGTTVFLGLRDFAPARKMLDSGVKVAIGTDFNPGSCAFTSQALMMNFAIANCKMTLEEALRGVTKTAAESLRRKNVGFIDINAQADLLVWKLDTLDQIPYYSTDATQKISLFVKKGTVFDLNKLQKLGLPKKVKVPSQQKTAVIEEKKPEKKEKKTADIKKQ